MPIATYNAGKAVMLSPLDEETTNYLVFSGNMVFCPIMEKTGQNHDSSHDINTSTYDKSRNTFNDFYELTENPAWNLYCGVFHGRVAMGESAFYQQQFLEDGVWNDTYTYQEMSYPYISEYGGESEEIKFNYSENPTNNTFDNIRKVPILECQLKVGEKYCVETFDEDGNSVFQWLTIDQCPTYVDDYDSTTKVHNTFSLGFDPAIGDKLIGKQWPISTNFDVTTNIEATEGTAIPIHASDNLTGEFEFKILGVINATWEQVIRRHTTWFRHTTYHSETKALLHNMHAIQIDNFEAKVYTDNAKLENDGDNDIVYYSSEQTTYLEKKDDITFKINTALTSQEAHDLGVKNTVNLSSVVRLDTGAFIDKVTNTINNQQAKPEEHYVESFFSEYSTPKMIVDTTLHRTESPFTRYSFSYLAGKQFMPLSEEYSYLYDTNTLKLKEV